MSGRASLPPPFVVDARDTVTLGGCAGQRCAGGRTLSTIVEASGPAMLLSAPDRGSSIAQGATSCRIANVDGCGPSPPFAADERGQRAAYESLWSGRVPPATSAARQVMASLSAPPVGRR
jgi:hypothetical protein